MTRLTSAIALIVTLHIAGATSAQDWDGDWIDDAFEDRLVEAFFPDLHMNCGEYNGTSYGSLGQFYGSDRGPGTFGRLPYVAHIYVDPTFEPCATSGQCIEIRFGMAYNWDLGDDLGDLIGNPFNINDEHPGDTEMISLLLRTTQPWEHASGDIGDWYIFKIFTAAHACTGDDSSAFGTLNNVYIPDIWVSEGKNSSYLSKSACDDGGFADADNCDNNTCSPINRSVALSRMQNAGEFGDPTIGPFANHIARSHFTNSYVGLSGNNVIPTPNNDKNSHPVGNYDVWGAASFGRAGPFCRHLTRFLDWANENWSCDPHPDCP